MSGEALALCLVNKINNKLKFLNRKNIFMAPAVKRVFVMI